MSSKAPSEVSTGTGLKRAVVYLRVSTAKQADKDENIEGYSLPAQREACYRKAETLGADVVTEYVDRGESAKTADRVNFQRMLARIQRERDVDYVIVDKLDRFARNRRDDANILFELKLAGAQLVSVKENIDDTAPGQLLHAIMAGISEFYSRNLASESLKGMTQKAQSGGTPGRAPIGYLNVRRRIDGREIRTVAVDPERAPMVQWAFEAYASGEWTLTSLTDALEAKGFRAAPDRRHPVPLPFSRSRVAHMLRNRYYLGYVTFRGVEYTGRHQPIVSQQVFDRVGDLLTSRRNAAEKQRVHNHYLKGTVFCAGCGSRLCLTQAKGKYLYFFCLGRHARRTDCQQPFMPADVVEAAVERHWQSIRLPDDVVEEVKSSFVTELERLREAAGPEIEWAKRRVDELEQERRRLAHGVVSGAIPEDLAREEQDRIKSELRDATRIAEASKQLRDHVEDGLDLALSFAGRIGEAYLRNGPKGRRYCNQFFFKKLLLWDGEVAAGMLDEPWSTLMAEDFIDQLRQNAANPSPVFSGEGLKEDLLVPPAGFEPATPGLGNLCSIP